jgi:hypothetical protein
MKNEAACLAVRSGDDKKEEVVALVEGMGLVVGKSWLLSSRVAIEVGGLGNG